MANVESREGVSESQDTMRDAYRVMVLGRDVPMQEIEPQSSISEEDSSTIQAIFKKARVLKPPFDPKTLLRIWENSSSLNQNVESYMTNIDGLGHRLEPLFDFDSDEVFERVREALWLSRQVDDEADDFGDLPSDDEVEVEIEKLRRRSRMEHIRLSSFFTNANPNGSFESLRRATRQDEEISGNAYWEVLRNKVGRVSRFVLVPSTSMRLTSVEETPTEVTDRVPAGPLGWDEVVQYRFFRRYVQAIGKKAVYFKEFADPRVISRNTGRAFKDMQEFEAWRNENSKDDQPANEVLHFKLPRPGEAYGIPRWIGNLLAVLGSRAADEVNFDYFDNKAIPPMALLVQGGRLGADNVSKIETYIRDNIKGRGNFHKILIIEAAIDKEDAMAGVSTQPKLEFKPLQDGQQGDALFQNYDERNTDKIGSSFRLPRLMRGDVRDFNRATADASRRFSEEQVFQPERNEFDSIMNRTVLPALDIRLWHFRSLGHRTRDPEIMIEVVTKAVKHGVLNINEGRMVLSDSIGRDFAPYEEFWAMQPLEITLAGIRPSDDPEVLDDEEGEAGDKLERLAAQARRLAAERRGLTEQAGDDAMDRFLEEAQRELAEQEEIDG